MDNVKNIIKRGVKNGYTFAVGDGEGNIQKRTNKTGLLLDAINAVEESYLRVWKGSTKGEGHLGYIYLCDNRICDYSVGLDKHFPELNS